MREALDRGIQICDFLFILAPVLEFQVLLSHDFIPQALQFLFKSPVFEQKLVLGSFALRCFLDAKTRIGLDLGLRLRVPVFVRSIVLEVRRAWPLQELLLQFLFQHPELVLAQRVVV